MLYCVVFLDQNLYSTLSLSTQVYKWVLLSVKGILTVKLGGNPGMD